MPFVKLDCGILDSTVWDDRDARDVFLTALLMAEPREFEAPEPQIKVDALEATGWCVPAGWYGFVAAAGSGIARRAHVPTAAALAALARMGDPEQESRSKEFDGRRLVRVNGGYVVLNFQRYRDRDYTAADRSRRYRARLASRRGVAPSRRDITQAEVEAEAEPKGTATRARKPRAARPKPGTAWHDDPDFTALVSCWPVERRGNTEAAFACWEGQGIASRHRIAAEVHRIAAAGPVEKLKAFSAVVLEVAHAPHVAQAPSRAPETVYTCEVCGAAGLAGYKAYAAHRDAHGTRRKPDAPTPVADALPAIGAIPADPPRIKVPQGGWQKAIETTAPTAPRSPA